MKWANDLKLMKKNSTLDRYDDRLDLLESAVRTLHNKDNPTVDDYYALVLLGYRVYKSGVGLPQDAVKEAIVNGLMETAL